jgi:hypothetical protein
MIFHQIRKWHFRKEHLQHLRKHRRMTWKLHMTALLLLIQLILYNDLPSRGPVITLDWFIGELDQTQRFIVLGGATAGLWLLLVLKAVRSLIIIIIIRRGPSLSLANSNVLCRQSSRRPKKTLIMAIKELLRWVWELLQYSTFSRMT